MDENPYKSPLTRGVQRSSKGVIGRLMHNLIHIVLWASAAAFGISTVEMALQGILRGRPYELGYAVAFSLVAFALFYATKRISP